MEGAPKALVQAASAADPTLRQAAVRAIRALTVDDVLATKLCEYGALETIQGVALSVGAPSRFALAAFEQLLDHNLSAKYTFRNELKMTDAITGPFFDSGRAKEGQAFVPLSEIKAAPVNGHRAVLLVDIDNDPELAELIAEVKAGLVGVTDILTKAGLIAATVSKQMGGQLKAKAHRAFSFDFVVGELKRKLGSNVLPIGMVCSPGFGLPFLGCSC